MFAKDKKRRIFSRQSFTRKKHNHFASCLPFHNFCFQSGKNNSIKIMFLKLSKIILLNFMRRVKINSNKTNFEERAFQDYKQK